MEPSYLENGGTLNLRPNSCNVRFEIFGLRISVMCISTEGYKSKMIKFIYLKGNLMLGNALIIYRCLNTSIPYNRRRQGVFSRGGFGWKSFLLFKYLHSRLDLFWGMKLTKKRTLKKKWKRKIFSPQKEWKKVKKHHFLLQKLNILLIKLTFNSLITIFNLKGSL